MTQLEDLTGAADAIAREISMLSVDRTVYERFAGIVRENDDLLRAAQTNNPFVNGTRRWWALATAVVLRRQIDGGPGTLRHIVQKLAELHPERREQFETDHEALERLSTRFRTYFNELIHGAQQNEVAFDSPQTYAELSQAVETVRIIAERACCVIRSVSLRLDPVIQFDWTEVFRKPWISGESDSAYNLGAPGVPFDAEPLTRRDFADQASLVPEAAVQADGSVTVSLRNVGKKDAIDARFFLPYERTIMDFASLPVGSIGTSERIPADRARRVSGQLVIEFSDVRGRVFREYADVTLYNGIFRNLSGPYLVRDRIVAPQLAGTV